MSIPTRFLILILLSLFIVSCCDQGRQGKSDNTAEISRFLDEWHSDASRADMAAYFDKIDSSGIYIGTDATEHWTRQAFYDWSKPHFDKGKAWSFQAEERHIYLSEDQKMAWFDEKLNSSSGPLRGSGVLASRDGKWKIMQYVLSVPVPNEKFREVREAMAGK